VAESADIDRYVPANVLARVGSGGDGWATLDGTLCFADISGFTALSEKLATRGRVGAEELTEVLNRVFGEMLRLAWDRGGTLLKYGGDALLLLFEGPDHAVQAASAAVEMRAALRRAVDIPTSVGRVMLRMSVGLHSGPVYLFLPAGTHRELIVAGPTASWVNEMEGTAVAGEIVVSDDTRDRLPSGAATKQKGNGWLLRWRTARTAPSGPPPGSDRPERVSQNYLSSALRTVLTVGATDSEHRMATVVFTKVVGIDDHIATVGAEATAREIGELVEHVTRIADAEEVTFLATDVDANAFKIILVAGVPTTSMDEDGKALRAARRIADIPTPLGVKIGVNRGHVFSGEVGSDLRATYTIMGDTVNLAARLMAAAPVGSVYATPQVVDGSTTLFSSEPVEPFYVKGKTQPVRALELGEETGTRTAREATTVPFVGRVHEVGLLRDAVARVSDRQGSAFAVTGPTGIGKTRTVEEAISGSGVHTIEMRAEPYGAANPYRPFRDPVRALLGIERASNDEMSRTLVATVERVAPSLVAMAPLLGDITQVDVADTEASAAIDPRFRQSRTIDTFVAVLAAVHPDPLIMVGEDMHWADAASEALIARLAVEAHSHPWLVIQTCRNRIQQEAVTTLTLEPLDEGETVALVHAASEAAPLLPDVVRAVADRSGGNPLFTVELVRVVRDTGDVGSLPTSLDGVVGSQIDNLEPLSRRVLLYLSVLGRSFRISDARTLLASQGVTLDQATRERLNQFLEEDGPDRLQFRHAMVRDTAYEALSFRRRKELHLRAGQIVLDANAGKTDAVADILGLHFFLAGDAERAWEFCRIAGDRNMERYANREAEHQFTRAIEAGRRIDGVTDADRRDVWVKLGDVRERLGDFDSSLDAYRRALALARGEDEAAIEILLRRARAKERAGRYSTALADTTRSRRAARRAGIEPLHVRAIGQAAVIRQAQQRPSEAMRAAVEAIDAARTIDDDISLARAYSVLDYALVMRGDLESAVNSEMALEIYRRHEMLEEEAKIAGNLGVYDFWRGDWDSALNRYREAREVLQRLGNEVDAATAAGNIGEVLVYQGRHDEALEPLTAARRTYAASGFEGIAFVDVLLGRIFGIDGDLAASEEYLTEAIEVAERLGLDGFALEASIHLADATCRAGDPERGLDILAEAVRTAPSEYLDYYKPLLARINGSILATAGRLEDALEALEAGHDAALGRGDDYEAAVLVLAIERIEPDRIDQLQASQARETLRTLGVRSVPDDSLS
jgi:class 3 adenylate cyclase/tetratricopeptide (TPR) repeat protein